MTGLIGYYVHHQGEGHRQRAAAIAAAYRGPMTLIGTGVGELSGEFARLDLPDDRMPQGAFNGQDGATRPPALHYAPRHHEGLQKRVAMIANWIAASRPDLMIVDVSVEVAMLARLASVPVVYVRLHGRRDDRPHRDLFESATALLAPFAEALEDPSTPEWVQAKTLYAPGIVGSTASPHVDPSRVLVVIGKGGTAANGERWAEAAAAVPDRFWRVIGPSTLPARSPANLEFAGWVDDAEAEIAGAGVVIGAAGDGLVSNVLAYARPFICFPETRPFDEQVCKAARLAALDAAIVPDRWPSADRWRIWFEAAERQSRERPSSLGTGGGAGQVAHWLAQMAMSQRVAMEKAS